MSKKKVKAKPRHLKSVKVAPPPPPKLKLDLGCGQNKREGFIGVDITMRPGVDQVVDLRGKWPWEDGSADQVVCSHFVEHLTQDERVHFFNELWRILVPVEFGPDGKPSKGFAEVITPHWMSERAYGDPTHKWPPVVAMFYHYLHRDWRVVNAPHTGLTCFFEFMGGNQLFPEWNARNPETQMFAQTHYNNVAADLVIYVLKREMDYKPPNAPNS